tara:strand:+ start:302 stop:427 length:126 start_codon:yes stop_codon:yes gene_type:complete
MEESSRLVILMVRDISWARRKILKRMMGDKGRDNNEECGII